MIYKYWDDKAIVYHPFSGDAHLLSFLNAKILEQLESSSCFDSIAERILNNPDLQSQLENKDELLMLISSLSQSFKHMGLLNNQSSNLS